VAGVDEINHMPGFRYGADIETHPMSEFEISEADARLAARRGTYVVTTLAGSALQLAGAKRSVQDQLNTKNLALLLRNRVRLALGSDSYRADTLPEALYINSLHVMSNLQLINIWSSATAATIFPLRKIGKLRDGYEASFIVLNGNPVESFSAVQQIIFEVKQGQVLGTGDLLNNSAARP